jgi:hypothetical protein
MSVTRAWRVTLQEHPPTSIDFHKQDQAVMPWAEYEQMKKRIADELFVGACNRALLDQTASLVKERNEQQARIAELEAKKDAKACRNCVSYNFDYCENVEVNQGLQSTNLIDYITPPLCFECKPDFYCAYFTPKDSKEEPK